MSALDQFNKIVTDFDIHADFLTIYIREAHPLDEWYVAGQKGASDIYQHSTIDERISAAKILKDYGMPCPVLLDSMDNEGLYEYAALPEAIYIIQNDIVRLKGLGPGSDYSPDSLRKWLESYVRKQ